MLLPILPFTVAGAFGVCRQFVMFNSKQRTFSQELNKEIKYIIYLYSHIYSGKRINSQNWALHLMHAGVPKEGNKK